MSRYALFAGWDYYPQGGWNDFVMSSDDLEELRADIFRDAPEQNARVQVFTEYRRGDVYDGDLDWWHIIDLKTGAVVDGDQGETSLHVVRQRVGYRGVDKP